MSIARRGAERNLLYRDTGNACTYLEEFNAPSVTSHISAAIALFQIGCEEEITAGRQRGELCQESIFIRYSSVSSSCFLN